MSIEMFSLKEKKVLITGAANGNGLEITKGLLDCHAKVIMADSDLKALKKNYEIFKRRGLPVYMEYVDLNIISEIKNLIKNIKKKHSDLSVIVNNACITYSEEIDKYDLEKWNTTHNINLLAPFVLIRDLVKTLKKNKTKNPSIINITSLNSELGFTNNPAYIASKGGLKQLSKSFSNDLGKFNIRSNCIGPGYIKTKMTAKSFADKERNKFIKEKTILGRWGKSSDLVGAVIFLASDASLYITGQDIYVDGGWLAKGL